MDSDKEQITNQSKKYSDESKKYPNESKIKNYKNIILGGGGIKGISTLGSLQELEKLGCLSNLNKYIGSSVGGLLAVFLAIGYSVSDLSKIAFEINFKKFQSYDISNIFEKYGVDNGNLFMNLMKAIFNRLEKNLDITFIEYNEKYKKEIILTGSNISKNEPIYFDKKLTPNLKILEALRMTISFPFYFTPVLYQNNYVIDGGALSPFPIEVISRNEYDETIGIILHGKNCEFDIKTFEDYFFSIINGVMDNFEKNIVGDFKNIIYIDNCNQNSLNFDLSKEEKIKLFNHGKLCCQKFFT